MRNVEQVMNMKASTVDEKYAATVDFEQLLVATGLLNTPKMTVIYSEETKKFLFEQEIQEEESGYVAAGDHVYGVLYEMERGRARLVTLRDCGESDSTSFALPEEWDNTKVYCFAMLKSGKGALDSLLFL